ncbi:hypothetical protein WT81_30865 [Burkholderia stagnalis]|nr:hypothetical protein WT81_30865 [Burkholderia stagnalis]KWK54569.1 hypothetical protein WT80_03795 [Burkholderia stagnalis]
MIEYRLEGLACTHVEEKLLQCPERSLMQEIAHADALDTQCSQPLERRQIRHAHHVQRERNAAHDRGDIRFIGYAGHKKAICPVFLIAPAAGKGFFTSMRDAQQEGIGAHVEEQLDSGC